jgi:hypothetical protein
MTRSLLAALFALAFLSSGCVRYYYKPNAVNTPLFTGPNQAHISVAGSSGTTQSINRGKLSLLDVQAACSPVNHLGIIANYSHLSFKAETPDFILGNEDAKAYMIEAGAGYYYALGDHKVKMVAEAYAGGGVGSISSDVNMRISRLFVQGGIGLRSPWVDLSFSPRFSRVRYSHFDDRGHDIYYLAQQELAREDGDRIDKHNYYFFEPCFTLRGGYKFVKLQLQCALADKTSDVNWNYSAAWVTFGVYLSIEDMLKFSARSR